MGGHVHHRATTTHIQNRLLLGQLRQWAFLKTYANKKEGETKKKKTWTNKSAVSFNCHLIAGPVRFFNVFTSAPVSRRSARANSSGLGNQLQMSVLPFNSILWQAVTHRPPL